MIYTRRYRTPDGFDDLKLVSDEKYLREVSFINRPIQIKDDDIAYFRETISWLDMYFDHQIPDFMPEYKIDPLSDFRKKVLNIVKTIPYGQTMTYGQIGEMIAKEKGIARMSAQAVGQAVGSNPICIIIPCHRVIGVNGKLIGYGGDIKNKAALLCYEGNL